MRVVQHESEGGFVCGVEHEGNVFATGYGDTLSLIRDVVAGTALTHSG